MLHAGLVGIKHVAVNQRLFPLRQINDVPEGGWLWWHCRKGVNVLLTRWPDKLSKPCIKQCSHSDGCEL